MSASSALREHLQSSLGTAYALERELGGGGMSRVFVAQDTALGRAVVIKVLAPELVAGISAERFAREVRLAARLQQANIVPVLSAGVVGDLPAGGKATPMTYEANGRQFVAIAAGGDREVFGFADRLVVFALR